jgi:hypothetical protein
VTQASSPVRSARALPAREHLSLSLTGFVLLAYTLVVPLKLAGPTSEHGYRLDVPPSDTSVFINKEAFESLPPPTQSFPGGAQ